MPIYEYRCDACEHLFDALQKVNDAHLSECPECGGQQVRRLVSAPSFRLKGAGWYETDFKSDKERKRNLAGDKDAPSKDSDGKGDKPSSDKPSSDKPSGDKPAKDKDKKSETKTKADKKKPGGKGRDAVA